MSASYQKERQLGREGANARTQTYRQQMHTQIGVSILNTTHQESASGRLQIHLKQINMYQND
jgi:hypothetical protein